MILNERQIKESLREIHETKNKDALWLWIKLVFKTEIPRKAICKDHDAPFDFISDVFFGNVKDVIAVANRGGGKTIDFSILDALNSYLFDNCETATVGAIEEQAKKCYAYFQSWITGIPIFAKELVDSLQSMTKFYNGSLVQILTGTIRGVNSPHPQKAFFDEVELMTWQVIQEAFSMAQSKGDIKGQTILTSTRKFAYGPMERLLEEAPQRGFTVYIWCIMETIERHDSAMCEMSIFNADCQGRCQECDGFYKLEDAVAAKRKLDDDTWDSQWRCLKPSSTGLVYPQFNDRIHIQPCPPDLGAELYLAEDFGFAEGHANPVGFFQEFAGKKKMIGEVWAEGKTDDEIIDLVEEKLVELGFVQQRYMDMKKAKRPEGEWKGQFTSKVKAWYCPCEEPSKITLRKRAGYRVSTITEPEIRKISYGTPLIRKDLADEMLFFDPSCFGTISEFKKYPNRKRADGTILDEPDKKFDNGPDMVRYFYMNHVSGAYGGGFPTEKRNTDNTPITSGVMDMTF